MSRIATVETQALMAALVALNRANNNQNQLARTGNTLVLFAEEHGSGLPKRRATSRGRSKARETTSPHPWPRSLRRSATTAPLSYASVVNGIDTDTVRALIESVGTEPGKGMTHWRVASAWQHGTHSRAHRKA